MGELEDVFVLDVRGEVDVASSRVLESRLAEAVRLRRSIVVDLGECTFADVAVADMLRRSFERASSVQLGFAVVLPFSAAAVVRRLLLELAPDLAAYPVLPSRAAATRVVQSCAVTLKSKRRLYELRAETWALGRRGEDLLAERDALIMEGRRLLAARREPVPSGPEG